MSTSKELAVIVAPSDKPAPDKPAEKVDKPAEKITPPVEVMHIHSALLLAAESSMRKDMARPELTGVFLHRVERVGRIVAADGFRVFIGSFALPTPMPTWLKDGVILDGDGLRKRVQMIAGYQDDPMIKLSHTKGSGFIELSDSRGNIVFKCGRIARPYVNYEGLLGPATFANLDEDGNVRSGREFQAIGINSSYLKHTGEVAKMLEAGLPKGERTKTGMVIRAFSASPNSPMVFDFSSWPGAIMVVGTNRLADEEVSKPTAALFSRATKLTLAALQAHATRQLAWAEEAASDWKKQEHLAKAKGFQERIAAIMASQSAAAPAIGSDVKAEPTPEPDPTAAAEAAETEPKQQPTTADGNGWDAVEQEPDWMTALRDKLTDPPEDDVEQDPEPAPAPEPDPEPEDEDTTEEPAESETPTIVRTKIKIARKK